MKYMLLIYNNPDHIEGFTQAEQAEVFADVDALMDELTKAGELTGGDALAHPSGAKTVRVVNGVPATTDGPYLESKEVLAGYVMIETDDPQRAIDIAARWPDAKWGAIEVRAVMDPGGMEM